MTWAGDLSTVAPALPCPLLCLAAPGWLDLAPEAPGTAPRSVYEEGWWAGRRRCQQSLLGGTREAVGWGAGLRAGAQCVPRDLSLSGQQVFLSISIEPDHQGDDKLRLLGAEKCAG